MLQSLLETAKNNPFGNPLPVAQCEAANKGPGQNLVYGREIAAAATSYKINPGGR